MPRNGALTAMAWSAEMSAAGLSDEVILDCLSSKVRQRHASAFSLMPKAAVQFVRQLDRGAPHVCQHTTATRT